MSNGPSSGRVRIAEPGDLARIKEIAVAAGMFTEDEVLFFDDMFEGFLNRSLDGHQWLVAEEGTEITAAAQYAPEPFSDRLWNLYFIAVDPKVKGRGFGSALMARVEADLRTMGQDQARVLIVETSSTGQYAGARRFYSQLGYAEEARIRQFYGPEDDKVTFWKSLVD